MQVLLVVLREHIEELLAILLGLVEVLGSGMSSTAHGLAVVAGIEEHGLHLDEIDDASERRGLSLAEPAPMGMTIGTAGHAPRVGVSERGCCSRRLAKLAPTTSILLTKTSAARRTCWPAARRFPTGPRPLSGRRTRTTAAIEHAQAALDLGGEIDVAGGIDQVDRCARATRMARRPSRW